MPIRGNWMCVRSTTLIAPVVKRTDWRPRPRFLIAGKATGRPRRFPHRLSKCAFVMDRDLNAAKNLAALAAQVHHVAGSGPETQNARRRDVRPAACGQTLMKREAGPNLMGVAPPFRKERRLETVE